MTGLSKASTDRIRARIELALLVVKCTTLEKEVTKKYEYRSCLAKTWRNGYTLPQDFVSNLTLHFYSDEFIKYAKLSNAIWKYVQNIVIRRKLFIKKHIQILNIEVKKKLKLKIKKYKEKDKFEDTEKNKEEDVEED